MIGEFCAGNLSDLVLGKYKGPSLGSINSICRQIAKGVQHLHLLKIVHEDIKPSNILISIPKGALGPQLKLSDFGLCHAFRNEFGSEESSFRPAFTNGWMCPSDYQVDQEGNRNSSFDIFPMGLVLGFTASNGVYPFGTDLKEAIERMENQQPMTLAPQQIDESIQSASFLDLLGKMLDYDATKRPTASEIPDHPFFKKQTIIALQQQEGIPRQLPLPLSSTPCQSIEENPNQTRQLSQSTSDVCTSAGSILLMDQKEDLEDLSSEDLVADEEVVMEVVMDQNLDEGLINPPQEIAVHTLNAKATNVGYR